MKNLDDMPEEERNAIIGALLRSAGVGPIDTDDEDAPTIMIEGAGESDAPDAKKALSAVLAGLMAKRASTMRPATLDEVLAFNKPHEPPLRVGDSVRWRPGQRNARYPEEGEVCIVSDLIDPPIREQAAGDRDDMTLAYVHVHADGTVSNSEVAYDSRRFERVEKPPE